MANIAQQATAKYLIEDTFKITGRGLVFAGYIMEGSILTGDIIEFTVFGTVLHRKIMGVENGRKADKPFTGLLIKCQNEIEIDHLRNWKPNDQVALIFKSETLDMNLIATEVDPPKIRQTWWQKFLNFK